MVPGMASIFPDTPPSPPARTDVTDWLNAQGGVVVAVTVAVLVIFGVVSQVIG